MSLPDKIRGPNLQNIPMGTSMGRRIREAFVPPGGDLSADYSQIESRALDHFSGDHKGGSTLDTKLPDKLSDLLELALNDCQIVFTSGRYIENMEYWHHPKGDRCAVCMAGAVMANTLRVPIEESVDPTHMESDTLERLLAINDMRTGEMFNAYERLNGRFPTPEDHYVLSEVKERIRREAVNAFRADWSVYREVVETLRKAGL